MIYIADRKRHLVCVPYSIENLHKMAKDLGIKECWFHKNHYDIPKHKINWILESGMVKVIDSKEIVKIIKNGNKEM